MAPYAVFLSIKYLKYTSRCYWQARPHIHMYMYIHIYIHTCISTLHISIHMCLSLYIDICISIRAHLYPYVCINTYTCMRMCVYIYMYIYIYMHVYPLRTGQDVAGTPKAVALRIPGCSEVLAGTGNLEGSRAGKLQEIS